MKQGTIEKILLNIEKHVNEMMKAFGKLNESEMKTIQSMNKLSEKIVETTNQLEMTKKEWNSRKWIVAEESKTKIESLNISKEINRERIFGKRLLEQEHRDNVQSNIKLRESFKQMDVTMGRVTKMFGGVTPLQVAGMGVGATMGMTRARMQHSSLTEAIDAIHHEQLKQLFTPRSFTPEGKQDAELLSSKLRSIERDLTNVKETKAFKIMEDNPILQAMSKQLEKVGNFMAKHSTGVIISVVSLGLLIGLFKAALSVSPMLQKMLELMTMTFGLILRPFGDFFGFILRPIAMAFLSTVMPFFKDMYPRMMTLGDQIGNSLLPLVTSILVVLESIFGVLDYASDPKNQESISQSGTIIAGGLGSTAGIVGGRKIISAIQNAKRGYGAFPNRGSLMPNFKNMFTQQGMKDAFKNVRGQKAGYIGVAISLLGALLPLLLGEANAVDEMTPEEGGQHNALLATDPSYRLMNDLTGNSDKNQYYNIDDKTIINYNQHIEKVDKDVDLNELTPQLNHQTHKDFKARK